MTVDPDRSPHAPPPNVSPPNATPRHATPRHATPRHAPPSNATPPHVTPRRTDTDDPRASRLRALKILFQADVRGAPVDATLDRLASDADARAILDDIDADDVAADVVRDVDDADEHPGKDESPAGRTARSLAAVAARVPEIDRFTRTLVVGVGDHHAELDELIARFARRWQVSRMPAVDRCVLRLAVYELVHEATPPPVVIDEAVTLAKTLSTDDSGRYVNGVLESIRKYLAENSHVASASGDDRPDVAASEDEGVPSAAERDVPSVGDVPSVSDVPSIQGTTPADDELAAHGHDSRTDGHAAEDERPAEDEEQARAADVELGEAEVREVRDEPALTRQPTLFWEATDEA